VAFAAHVEYQEVDETRGAAGRQWLKLQPQQHQTLDTLGAGSRARSPIRPFGTPLAPGAADARGGGSPLERASTAGSRAGGRSALKSRDRTASRSVRFDDSERRSHALRAGLASPVPAAHPTPNKFFGRRAALRSPGDRAQVRPRPRARPPLPPLPPFYPLRPLAPRRRRRRRQAAGAAVAATAARCTR
jgi:hypothetical protein